VPTRTNIIAFIQLTFYISSIKKSNLYYVTALYRKLEKYERIFAKEERTDKFTQLVLKGDLLKVVS